MGKVFVRPVQPVPDRCETLVSSGIELVFGLGLPELVLLRHQGLDSVQDRRQRC